MISVWKTIGLVCAAFLIDGTSASAAWQNMYQGDPIPIYAVAGGFDAQSNSTYVCRAPYAGGIHMGWTQAGKGNCSFGWGGLERTNPTFPYQIWVADWSQANSGNVPANALAFGSERIPVGPYGFSVEEYRYPCHAADPAGGITSGKAAIDIGGCDFPWGGVEEHQQNYSVLTDSALSYIDNAGADKIANSAPDPSAAIAVGYFWLNRENGAVFNPEYLVSGYEGNGGGTLYLCSAYYQDGYHIGKTRPDFSGCNISFGGREIAGLNPYYTLRPNWVFTTTGPTKINSYDLEVTANGGIPEAAPLGGGVYGSAIIGGNEEDGSHLYLCTAFVDGGKYPGKASIALGGCSVGVNGVETIVPTDANYGKALILLESFTKPIVVR